MTREEAIERLKQNKAAAEFYAGMAQNTNTIENELKDIEAMNMGIEALQADRLTEWIPVSERLPENSRCVLISIAGDIEFGAYDRQNSDWAIWRDGYWDEGKRVDAWMPLPEPYREDGEA